MTVITTESSRIVDVYNGKGRKEGGDAMLDTGCLMLDTGCSQNPAGWILDARCWMLDSGYKMIVDRWQMIVVLKHGVVLLTLNLFKDRVVYNKLCCHLFTIHYSLSVII